MKSSTTILLSALAGIVAASGVVLCDRYLLPREEQAAPVEAGPQPEFRPVVQLSQSDYPDFTYAAESAVGAVVYVKVTVRTGQYDYYGSNDPLFRFFYGDIAPQPREYEASGSGVVISGDGYIVTNNHVIENASTIRIVLGDNRSFPATLVGTDPATDIALLKIDAPEGLPYLELGDSDALRLGEWVIAIGSPFDLRSTITAGIVSAKGRSMPSYSGEFKVESFIQTDAAVNPGNSGGALVNTRGELVGINTAIISNTGNYAGYSFAVPSKIVSRIVSDLITLGKVRRASLGIRMTPVSENMLEVLKLSAPTGVYIYEALPGGAADEAGLRAGDVLLTFDGEAITDPSYLRVLVNDRRPGDVVAIERVRDGVTETVDVVLHEY